MKNIDIDFINPTVRKFSGDTAAQESVKKEVNYSYIIKKIAIEMKNNLIF